ncbi:hypothetical protein [Halegenticoccus soli]|uniref:hypothetical protein n=1 Tax=Halegenticoccus soli TaxID=1985678 RepID=UPI00117B9727|nr:hypothetical protein [Halegenticoccus soli]
MSDSGFPELITEVRSIFIWISRLVGFDVLRDEESNLRKTAVCEEGVFGELRKLRKLRKLEKS